MVSQPYIIDWQGCFPPSLLQKYIDVDIYGGCGIPCKKGKEGKCWKELPVKYKFYLSFENSLCDDYVSEKFFKIYSLDMHVIPVTRGRTPYKNYFPQNTFIDSADFPSPRELAEHLKSLGSDIKRYAQMLEEKDQYQWFGWTWVRFGVIYVKFSTQKPSPQRPTTWSSGWMTGIVRRQQISVKFLLPFRLTRFMIL